VSGRPLRIRIEVSGRPEPGLIRAAIAARLERRPFPAGPEDEIAARVARAVRGRAQDHDETEPRWR
jgi:hypothetical protein